MNDEQLDNALKRALERTAAADKDAANRILRRLDGPLPKQKSPLWRWPTVLIDWQFAPAWPRVAALAACAAFGFFIGMVGLDRRVDDAEAGYAMTRADVGSFMFEPETFTGARP
jgi:hypothetical protein